MKPSCFFLVLLVLLISLHSLSGNGYGTSRSFKDPNLGAFPRSEDLAHDVDMLVRTILLMKKTRSGQIKAGRKLMGVNGLQLKDYDPPGANPAHNPPPPSKKAGKGSSP
ncbi:hypothetical protein SAY86_028219 [Trapa natans]|uniref:Uncharacterized protein n=1 Tax=Trapa natans TaxID=22666 RepID=A0AAN7MH96_TRANT|nr:hypothetical protein SAY86_028219 [Trapa natans]